MASQQLPSTSAEEDAERKGITGEAKERYVGAAIMHAKQGNRKRQGYRRVKEEPKRVTHVTDATDRQIEAMNYYAQEYFRYELGVRPYKVAEPVALTKKQSAKVRSEVRKEIKERFPNRK